MRILGIETSCDDTCAAVVEAKGSLRRPRFLVRSNVISSQIKTHARYGGVVPSLAARDHARHIAPVIQRALKDAGCKIKDIDLIAVTTHPGLLPSLLIGVHAARALAWMYKKPIIGVDHLLGHASSILLPRIRRHPEFILQDSKIFCPAIGLIVSGGHTQIVLQREPGTMRVVGETRDDAAGEAFDKIARLLGLPYSGGPAVAARASQFRIQNSRFKISLPRPMMHSNNLDMSFSGLKTAVLYLLRDLKKRGRHVPVTTICNEVQQAIIDVLVAKTIRAAKHYRVRSVFLAGGVSANHQLRQRLHKVMKHELPNAAYTLPLIPYTQDNAAMIAAAGYIRWQHMTPHQRTRASWKNVRAKA